MASLLRLTRLTALTRTLGSGGNARFVVLTKADGTVFTTADGAVLIRRA